MPIIIITFDAYTGRGPEVIGPFDNSAAAQAWISDLEASGVLDDADNALSVATFTIDKVCAPWDVKVKS